MGKSKVVEDPVIPPQDGKICGTICVCQMTCILSCVALVYLTVAIYMPSSRAFSSGIAEVPIMCTTTRAVNQDACEWGSCGEWCLSKTSGACIQIYVTLRRNGSSLLFANCTNVANKTCYGIDQENAKKYRCIADDCKNLTGTFNCSIGVCVNITDAFECVFAETDPALKCSGRRGKITCIDIDGLFNCTKGTCERIRTPYNCDRRCVDIPTRNKNVILLSGDKVYLSQCERATDLGTGAEVWTEDRDDVLVSSCFSISNGSEGVSAVDCVNGSVLRKDELADLTNFTHLTHLHAHSASPVPLIAPPEAELVVANESRLMINLEGCVNTLQDECRDFLKDFGKDGTDHNARARFPCFYADGADMVVARFDLETTYRQFLVAAVLPSVLFVVSCLTLLLCQKAVVVGDDAKMRFKGCAGGEAPSEGAAAVSGADSAMARSPPAREPSPRRPGRLLARPRRPASALRRAEASGPVAEGGGRVLERERGERRSAGGTGLGAAADGLGRVDGDRRRGGRRGRRRGARPPAAAGRADGGGARRRARREGQVLLVAVPRHVGDPRRVRVPVSDPVRGGAGDRYDPRRLRGGAGDVRGELARVRGGHAQLLVGVVPRGLHDGAHALPPDPRQLLAHALRGVRARGAGGLGARLGRHGDALPRQHGGLRLPAEGQLHGVRAPLPGGARRLGRLPVPLQPREAAARRRALLLAGHAAPPRRRSRRAAGRLRLRRRPARLLALLVLPPAADGPRRPRRGRRAALRRAEPRRARRRALLQGQVRQQGHRRALEGVAGPRRPTAPARPPGPGAFANAHTDCSDARRLSIFIIIKVLLLNSSQAVYDSSVRTERIELRKKYMCRIIVYLGETRFNPSGDHVAYIFNLNDII